jgi:hypothetical protein
MDRVADRLATNLKDALSSLDRLRDDTPLTDEEATVALSALLHDQGIRLNDGLLQVFVGHRKGSPRGQSLVGPTVHRVP